MPHDEPPVPSRGEIIIYEAPGGGARLDVHLAGDTLWLNLNQLAALFERDKSVISRHLRNVYISGELDRDATVAFFATVQSEGERTVTRQVEYFDLDAILSVGYRVNSRRGTQFRIWATGVLRDHLIRGYSVNERRLRELRLSLKMVRHAVDEVALHGDEATALVRLVTEYAYAPGPARRLRPPARQSSGHRRRAGRADNLRGGARDYRHAARPVRRVAIFRP